MENEEIDMADWFNSMDFPFKVVSAKLCRLFGDDVEGKISGRVEDSSRGWVYECGARIDMQIEDSRLAGHNEDIQEFVEKLMEPWARENISMRLLINSDIDQPEFRDIFQEEINLSSGMLLINFWGLTVETVFEDLLS